MFEILTRHLTSFQSYLILTFVSHRVTMGEQRPPHLLPGRGVMDSRILEHWVPDLRRDTCKRIEWNQ